MRQSDRSLTPGGRLLISFLFLWYVLPGVACLLFSNIEFPFRWSADRQIVWGIMVACVACVALPALLLRTVHTSIIGFPVIVKSWGLALVTLTTAVFGVYLIMSRSTNWRYGGGFLGDQIEGGEGSILLIAIAIQSMVPLLPWWLILVRPRLWMSNTVWGVGIRVAIVTTSVVNINGLATAISAAMTLIWMLLPSISEPILFGRRVRKVFRIWTLIAWPILVVAIVGLAYQGMSAKTGRTDDSETWESHTSIHYFVGRLSVHFQHAMGALEDNWDNNVTWDTTRELFAIPLGTCWYRANVLMGVQKSVDRPETPSLSRVNLERFATFDVSRNLRNGASPGLIGTIGLCFPLAVIPLACLAAGTCFICFFDWFLRPLPRLGWIGCLCFAYGPVRVLTDSPLDVLNIINSVTPILLFVCLLRVWIGRRLRQAEGTSLRFAQREKSTLPQLAHK